MADDIPFSYPLRGARLDSSDEAKAELEILRRLAAGKNPLTEALLPDDSCYQSAKVLRALLAAIKALEKAPRIRKVPPNAGKPWFAEEDADLRKRFDEGLTITDLAHKHERTRGSIRTRLEKLGKIRLYTPIGAGESPAANTFLRKDSFSEPPGRDKSISTLESGRSTHRTRLGGWHPQ